MNTPLRANLEEYLARRPSRFHTPGHKGRELPLLGKAARLDVTEVEGLDSLYAAHGPIAQTEAAYAALYGSSGSFLSAGGSTLCVQAMLALAAPPGSKVVAARGTHVSATNAMALLDLHPVWVWPERDARTGLGLGVSPAALDEALCRHPDAACVYLTCPSFFGAMCDLPALSLVCKRHRLPLLVDNAQGTYLRFLPGGGHPMDAGADICCDSLHKTLPVLTGGAVLHVKNPAFLSGAKQKMTLFGSTSPSYLILLSMDTALPYLQDGLRGDLERVSAGMAAVAALAAERGFVPVPSDPLRLTLDLTGAGYGREEFAALLRECRIEPEYLDGHLCVLLAGSHTSDGDLARLRKLMERCKPRPALPRPPLLEEYPQGAMPLREAALAPWETVAVEESPGRVAGGTITPCPPGIPLVVSGEKITGDMASWMKNYGISSVNVVK